MSRITDQKIIELLVRRSLLTKAVGDGIVRELSRDGFSLEESLVRDFGIESDIFLKIKSEILHVPIFSPQDKNIPSDILNFIPYEVALNHKLLAFDLSDSILHVAMVNPYDIRSIEALDFLMKQQNLKTEIYLIAESYFNDLLKNYRSIGQEVASVLEASDSSGRVFQEQFHDAVSDFSDENIKNAPVSQIVSVIIRHAVELGASDIHIEPEGENTHVRYRIDGVLHTSLTLPLRLHESVISRVKVLAKLKLDETRVPQDGRIKVKVDEHRIDIRVSTLPLLEHEKISMRILDTDKKIGTLDALGFVGSTKEKIERAIRHPYGLVLVTGPTGSGKTTTLYTLINMLKSAEINITTLEDPIEYEIAGINQSQIQPNISYTFANGLRSILRQDPDIIMVGEIRDLETAEMAIHAALTGHLLLSTLHTNNAFGALPRLIDMKVEPFLLASTLNAVIAQRLVRVICSSCREKFVPPMEVSEQISHAVSEIDKNLLPKGFDPKSIVLYKGKGCKDCGSIGYKNRVAISEVIEVTSDIKEIISQGCDHSKLESAAKKQLMITMQQDGFIKVLSGVTTYEEVVRVTRLDGEV